MLRTAQIHLYQEISSNCTCDRSLVGKPECDIKQEVSDIHYKQMIFIKIPNILNLTWAVNIFSTIWNKFNTSVTDSDFTLSETN